MLLRKAGKNDKTLLLYWENEPLEREMSFDSGIISEEKHKKWFEEKLKDPDALIYIGIVGNRYIGYSRFERENQSVTVSVFVDANLRGRGYGGELIRMGTQSAGMEFRPEFFEAFIKKVNVASQKAFYSAGYARIKEVAYKNQRALLYRMEWK